MPLDFTPMIAVHDAVRRDLVRFAGLLGGNATLPAGRIAALREHWTLVMGALAAHEQLEDDLLWPAARALPEEDAPGLAEAVRRAEAQHGAIDQVRGTTAAELAEFAGGAARDRLATHVEQLARLTDLHFAAEEQHVLPLLDRYLPVEHWDRFVRAGEATASPGGRDLMLPWLLQDASPRRVATILAPLGDYERTALDTSWTPAYQDRIAALW